MSRRNSAPTAALEAGGALFLLLIAGTPGLPRSEEHTSEIQSPLHLLCPLFFLMLRRPPSSTLFPYTTLSGSHHQSPGEVVQSRGERLISGAGDRVREARGHREEQEEQRSARCAGGGRGAVPPAHRGDRGPREIGKANR